MGVGKQSNDCTALFGLGWFVNVSQPIPPTGTFFCARLTVGSWKVGAVQPRPSVGLWPELRESHDDKGTGAGDSELYQEPGRVELEQLLRNPHSLMYLNCDGFCVSYEL